MRVDVTLLPPEAPPTGRTCLVVDVLRATSVMAVLFGRGVDAVWPAASIEEGRALRDALRVGPQAAAGETGLLLCGEHNAIPPEGYDYGNSPLEFERVALAPRVVMATTNGTPALHACAAAALTMPAAPLNASAVVRAAVRAGHDVLVVCAGLRGAAAEDDTVAAGLLVERLVRAGAQPGEDALDALGRYEA
ncbi:MAG: 2-phosphosulfolactate phosphatase, partial [Dehalococcoidia bacterium]